MSIDIDQEVTIEGLVICPECGHKFETSITGNVIVTLEPDDFAGDPD